MKSLATFIALAIAAVASIAATQETTVARRPAEGAKPVTATGEVVRYEAGKTIVLRQPDNREIAYELAPTLIVPAEVAVGKHVSIQVEPAADGTLRVTSITTLTADVAPSGGQLKQTTTYTHDPGTPADAIIGEVVRYEPGQAIVVKTDGKEVTYAIAPNTAAPEGVAAGRRVSIVTEASAAGPVLVTRITLDGEAGASADPKKTEVATTVGTVSAFEPGRSLTILRPNGTTATYTIDSASAVPDRLAAGRKVVVRTVTRPGAPRPVVRRVTFSKTTSKTTGTR